jgi:hypothetical protein
MLGVLFLILQNVITGHLHPSPDHLSQLGGVDEYLAWTLLWSPLWGFPAVIAMLAPRWVLLMNGWFGWASAIIAGALSGIAVPIMLGRNFALAGPLYGAVTLWAQQVIYRFRYSDSFNA